jgi:FMN phosphatase YigB (HAD superfamily)
MIRDTILFDLDGTLLPLDMDAYVSGFMKLMAGMDYGVLSHKMASSDVMDKAFGFMMSDKHGDMTNEQAYFFALNEQTGVSFDAAKAFFNKFYSEEFEKLKHTSKCEPISKQIVDDLKLKGYNLVLATNPLFDPTATYQRIAWAGLEKDDFSYITQIDNSCYCKPSPKYYHEVLGKINKKASQCYMIGNNVKEDMVAVTLGLEGFLLTDYLIGNIDEAPICEKGNYSDLLNYARRLPKI